jgi:hypothetical protein
MAELAASLRLATQMVEFVASSWLAKTNGSVTGVIFVGQPNGGLRKILATVWDKIVANCAKNLGRPIGMALECKFEGETCRGYPRQFRTKSWQSVPITW